MQFHSLAGLLVVCLCVAHWPWSLASPGPSAPPAWPSAFNACVTMYIDPSDPDYVLGGWYLDASQQAVRLDSFGVPLRWCLDHYCSKRPSSPGVPPSLTPLLPRDIVHEISRRDCPCGDLYNPDRASSPLSTQENAAGACGDAPPLYIIIWLYALGTQLFLAPSPSGSFHCSVLNGTTVFPSPLSLDTAAFVEYSQVNQTVLEHWRSDFFLFSADYFFHTGESRSPYKILYGNSENTFSSFSGGPQDPGVFMPPPDANCTLLGSPASV